jgi:hypothetical protein
MASSVVVEQTAELAHLGVDANSFDCEQHATLIDTLRPLGDIQRTRAARIRWSRNLALPIGT